MDNNTSPAQANRRSIYGVNGEPFQVFSGVFQAIGAYTEASYQYSNMLLPVINGPSFQGATVPPIASYDPPINLAMNFVENEFENRICFYGLHFKYKRETETVSSVIQAMDCARQPNFGF